jgi:hypothetical protein
MTATTAALGETTSLEITAKKFRDKSIYMWGGGGGDLFLERKKREYVQKNLDVLKPWEPVRAGLWGSSKFFRTPGLYLFRGKGLRRRSRSG